MKSEIQVGKEKWRLEERRKSGREDGQRGEREKETLMEE